MSEDHLNKRSPLILSIASGKGGVGKSLVSANLATVYAKEQLKVGLLDLDFGAFNLHTLFGLRKPQKGWGEYFFEKTQPLSSYLTPTPIPNLSLIHGAGFIPDMAKLTDIHKSKLLHEVRSLDLDLVLLDLGAGSFESIIDFFSLSDMRLLVTTPEPTALMNSYEFLRNVAYRLFHRVLLDQPDLEDKIKQLRTNKDYTVEKVLCALNEVDAWAAENLAEIFRSFEVYVILNQVKKLSDAQVGLKLKRAAQKFLSMRLSYPGFIFYNEQVSASIMKMSPIVHSEPQSITSKIMKQIAQEILSQHIKYVTDIPTDQILQDALNMALNRAKQDYKENYLTQRRLLKTSRN